MSMRYMYIGSAELIAFRLMISARWLSLAVAAMMGSVNEDPPATLRDELAAVAKRRGLRKLARRVQGHYGVDGPRLSHALLSRFAAGEESLSDRVALRVEAALGRPPGSYVETRAAIIREALTDPALVDALYRSLRRRQGR